MQCHSYPALMLQELGCSWHADLVVVLCANYYFSFQAIKSHNIIALSSKVLHVMFVST